jgi:hypothetical protein
MAKSGLLIGDVATKSGVSRKALRLWVNSVDTFKVTLCPAGCGQRPDVEVVGDEARIGETGNLAALKKDEWDLLVEPRSGGAGTLRSGWPGYILGSVGTA